jgi:hypothetical protein
MPGKSPRIIDVLMNLSPTAPVPPTSLPRGTSVAEQKEIAAAIIFGLVNTSYAIMSRPKDRKKESFRPLVPW